MTYNLVGCTLCHRIKWISDACYHGNKLHQNIFILCKLHQQLTHLSNGPWLNFQCTCVIHMLIVAVKTSTLYKYNKLSAFCVLMPHHFPSSVPLRYTRQKMPLFFFYDNHQYDSLIHYTDNI